MSVLHEIVERKKRDVARRLELAPLEAVKNGAKASRRSLAGVLSKPGRSFILEAKKASPSLGVIRADFDPEAIVREYEPFADALSILTDAPYFGGSHDYLAAARAITDKPLLCKDFIVSPYQVFEARRFGADAVLLMLSVLDDVSYRECAAAAELLSMDVLTEVHDEEEARRALSLGARIIGINNRNMNTLRVDLSVTERVAPLIAGDRIVVCESGIKGRSDLLRMSDHAGAFLIGGSLMGERDLGRAVRELIFGRVKICGLTRAEDAAMAYGAGASFGGLIFASQSPRRVSEKSAAEIMAAAPLAYVGVFVDSPAAETARCAEKLALAAVQLHGEEDAAYVRELRGQLPQGCEIWKAVRVKGAPPCASDFGCDRLLLDTYDGAARGGTGRSFDWSVLDGRGDATGMVLAGGINPDNVCAAAARGCYAIDVNSGVEEAPGAKSRELAGRLFAALRG